MTRSLVPAALLAALLSSSIAAAAPSRQDVAKADKLFREARALMAKNSFAEACPKLEQSQSLDPAPGTKYQLSVCYENTDRPATALAGYLEVADMAKAAGYKDKEKAARDKAAALEPKVPRITIEVAPDNRVTDLEITRDGAPVQEGQWNRPILVDPGEYTIEATAPGRKPFSSRVSVRGEGTRVTVPIALAPVEDFSKRHEIPKPPPKPGFGGMRIAGITVGVLGLGGVAAGSVFGFNAKSIYDKAIGDKSLCPTKTTCYPDGKRQVDQAQMDATISTIAFAAGGALVVGGLVLIIAGKPSAPAPPASGQAGASASAAVVPVLGRGFGGLTVVGEF
jgi:hypothetical protein